MIAASIGAAAVFVLDSMLGFTYISSMFAVFGMTMWLLPIQLTVGACLGLICYGIRTYTQAYDPNETMHDTQFLLGLMLTTICLTYLITIAAYTSFFPWVLFAGFYLVTALYALSMKGYGEDKQWSWWNKMQHIVSGVLIGYGSGVAFWLALSTFTTLVNPMVLPLWMMGLLGMTIQLFITTHLLDMRINVVTQWSMSVAAFAVTIAALCFVATPYLPLFLMICIPLVYSLARLGAMLPKHLSWHPIPENNTKDPSNSGQPPSGSSLLDRSPDLNRSGNSASYDSYGIKVGDEVPDMKNPGHNTGHNIQGHVPQLADRFKFGSYETPKKSSNTSTSDPVLTAGTQKGNGGAIALNP